jgi:Flp pilus assembly protein TadG
MINSLRKISARAKAATASFSKNADGSIAVMFGLMFIPLALLMGVSIDVARMLHGQSQISAALDAATTSAAASFKLSDAKRIELATQVFEANMPEGLLVDGKGKPEFKIVNGNFEASIDAEMTTTLMAMVGIETVKVGIESGVSINREKKAEVALVLDYSGSMKDPAGGAIKYIAMRDAATKLIDDVAAIDKTRVKFALVPFSHHVRAPLPGAYVVGATHTDTRMTCTQDRPYPANLSASTPTQSNATKWGQPQAPEHLGDGCGAYAVNKLEVRPLTSNFDALKTQLAAMRPYSWTHIALGAEFGHHVLSPNAPFTEGAPSNQKTTEKFMVLLTDGKQTEPGFGRGGNRDVTSAENNLVAICDNAKAEGIKIIAIAYDLDDSATRKNLAKCASSSSEFFVVNNAASLNSAFDSIKELLLTQMYVSR